MFWLGNKKDIFRYELLSKGLLKVVKYWQISFFFRLVLFSIILLHSSSETQGFSALHTVHT